MDIWAEYDSLLQKKAAGITDYSDEIESLSQVYDSVIENLEMSLQKMTQTIKDATVMLYEARALLMK